MIERPARALPRGAWAGPFAVHMRCIRRLVVNGKSAPATGVLPVAGAQS